jgi:23S rRNA (cytidine1920-2'-O)/16S rRNA (cytidine1409-2'-O)-methyltransferase
MAKKRVDVLMLERGLVESRTRAQALIMAGRVRMGDRVLSKPGDMIDEAAPLDVEQPETAYASRGGEKLAFALDRFGLDVVGMVALDVGASTGGFTDVLLRRGAHRVYAVDVGYGELAWALREDPRVVVATLSPCPSSRTWPRSTSRSSPWRRCCPWCGACWGPQGVLWP